MSSTQFEATVLAGDLGLLEERIVLKRTLTRGQLILFSTLSALLRPRASSPTNSANARCSTRSPIEQTLENRRAIQKAQSPVSAVGTAPAWMERWYGLNEARLDPVAFGSGGPQDEEERKGKQGRWRRRS